jgi:hypothetical protein
VARDPARAAEALRAVEEASRSAVAELHRLLGFLRADLDATGPALASPELPQPTLRDRRCSSTRCAGASST